MEDVSLSLVTAEDRRDASRLPAAELDVIIEHETLGSHPGTVLDISRAGARIISGICFPCGGFVVVTPSQESGLQPCKMEIMRRKLLPNAAKEKRYEYGMRFADPMNRSRHFWLPTLRRAA